ncbi:MAG TPA: VOC family protein [Prosthecobacter sp.]|nr:VOC family protein [Prosthecobacter sp.]
MIAGARFHHTGCLVPDLEAAVAGYQSLWGPDCASPISDVTAQSVRVCFVRPHPDSAALELIQPAEGTSLHGQLGRGTSYYHVGYEVSDFDGAVAAATAAGCRCMSSFISAAFDGRRCIFLYTPQRHLIELIEAAPSPC